MHTLYVKNLSAKLLSGLHQEQPNLPGNLYESLSRYHTEIHYRESIDTQIVKMRNYWTIFRFIYFIFNVKNYFKNYHTHTIYTNLSISDEEPLDIQTITLEQKKTHPNIIYFLLFRLMSCLGIIFYCTQCNNNYFYNVNASLTSEINNGENMPKLTLNSMAEDYRASIKALEVVSVNEQNKHQLNILGITNLNRTTIPLDEITKAYHKAALKHHPDKGGDSEAFKTLCDAKDKLVDTTTSENSIQDILKQRLEMVEAFITSEEDNMDAKLSQQSKDVDELRKKTERQEQLLLSMLSMYEDQNGDKKPLIPHKP